MQVQISRSWQTLSKVAKNRPPNYRRIHLAIIYDQTGNVINYDWNNGICAERNCIKNTDDIPPNSSMLVVQIRRKKERFTIGNSMPCKRCRDCIIKTPSISYVTYSLKDGSLTTCERSQLPINSYSAQN